MTFTSPAPGHAADVPPPAKLYDAVLFDRDGTLVHDVPYNGDPAAVAPVDGARAALARLRAAGLRIGVVTNQSGIARGLLTTDQVDAVNRRVEELLGPFDDWQVCPHDEAASCRCRKPAPGMIHAAARALQTTAQRCAVVGDIGRDMAAALAAGAAGFLVPTPVTLPEEVAAAPNVATDLPAAVDEILRRQRAVQGTARRAGRVLVARPDSAGDVLLMGPAIRAIAAHAEHLTLLCGPRGRAAAELLPGVDAIVEHALPWIDSRPGPVRRADMDALTDRLAGHDEAVILTSFHQSALPLALLLRMAGTARIAAISDDYPGSLLDVRHHVPPGVPEPERALSLAAAAGFPPPRGDDLALRLRELPAADLAAADPPPADLAPGYVVVHPGASVPARAAPPDQLRTMVAALAAAGHRVVVTGGLDEVALTAAVAGTAAVDLGGSTGLGALAGVLADAACVIVGNTGPAHLAAAVGTPVVSLYAPTVPYGQWGPYRVPAVRLGDATAPCRDSRASVCPVEAHPCLSNQEISRVLGAVALLTQTVEVPA